MNSSTIRDVEVTVDGSTETIRAERVSINIYYCLEPLVFIDLELYGCEIEVKEENSKLKFVRIHKASNFKTHVYVWSKEFLDSEKGIRIKKKIVEIGGDWEQVMGGMFFIYLPIERDHMLEDILKIAE